MSTETKHTPGPFGMSRDAVPPGHTQITIYAESDGGRIATVFCTMANAHLFVAAPDLLEACEGIMDLLDADLDAVQNWQKEADAIRRAIAKATGKDW